MEFTKRIAVDKGKYCKLAMMCGQHYRARLSYLAKAEPELAYYHFLFLFESSRVSGESGAHVYVIDMEVGVKEVMVTPGVSHWPISVTLNITLKEYRKLRKKPAFRRTITTAGKKDRKIEPMPEFKTEKPNTW